MPFRQRTQQLLSIVERAGVDCFLSSSALREYELGSIAKSHLEPVAASIRALAEQYVAADREHVALSRNDPAAYALYYLPVNIYKVAYLLHRVRAFLPAHVTRVIDFGSGPGTALYGLACTDLPAPSLDLIAIEQSAEMRSAARKLWATSQVSSAGWRRSEGSERAFSEPSDLVFMCNVLSECGAAEQERLLSLATQSIGSHGTLIILEPALMHTTQRLMELRDFLTSKKDSLRSVFPCSHSKLCPMRASDPQNWCHTQLTWDRPRVVRQLDELTGFNKHRIKLSALVVTRRQVAVDAAVEPATVITSAERSKIGFEALVCSETYYGPVRLSRRDRTEKNRPFESLEGWEQISMTPPIEKKVGADQIIKVR